MFPFLKVFCIRYEFSCIFEYDKNPTLLKAYWNVQLKTLMTVLQHRHSSIVLSTEGAHSRFHFFHNLMTTHTNLCFLPFGPLSRMFLIFGWLSRSFLPFSVTFQFLLLADTQSHKWVTPLSAPLQRNPAYFPCIFLLQSYPKHQKVDSAISLFLNKEILIAFSSKRSESWLTKASDSVTLVIAWKLTSCLWQLHRTFTQ